MSPCKTMSWIRITEKIWVTIYKVIFPPQTSGFHNLNLNLLTDEPKEREPLPLELEISDDEILGKFLAYGLSTVHNIELFFNYNN